MGCEERAVIIQSLRAIKYSLDGGRPGGMADHATNALEIAERHGEFLYERSKTPQAHISGVQETLEGQPCMLRSQSPDE